MKLSTTVAHWTRTTITMIRFLVKFGVCIWVILGACMFQRQYIYDPIAVDTTKTTTTQIIILLHSVVLLLLTQFHYYMYTMIGLRLSRLMKVTSIGFFLSSHSHVVLVEPRWMTTRYYDIPCVYPGFVCTNKIQLSCAELIKMHYVPLETCTRTVWESAVCDQITGKVNAMHLWLCVWAHGWPVWTKRPFNRWLHSPNKMITYTLLGRCLQFTQTHTHSP